MTNIITVVVILGLAGLLFLSLIRYLRKRTLTIKRMNCIFCPNPLDNSDEHLIPDSINGRLHSSKIICSSCNNRFGIFVDPIFKELLNPMLLAFSIKNANGVRAEGLGGEKYNYDKTGKVSPVRDEIIFTERDNQTFIRIQGGTKSALKTIKRQVEKFEKKGYKLKELGAAKITTEHNLLRIKFDLKYSPKLALGLNKIATEYYALCGLDTNLIKDLLKEVKDLSEKISNTVLCNWNGDIRDYDLEEISHLLVLRTDTKGTLYCYIELFNTICACVTLCEKFPVKVNHVYFQNAISGEKSTKEINFNYEPLEETTTRDENFEILINLAFERLAYIDFNKILTAETTKILEQFTSEESQNVIHKEHELEERLGRMVAELSMAFPYMIEDYKDELDDKINHINSNLIEEKYDEFCKKNVSWLGKDIEIDKELYKFDSFVRSPFLRRNNISLIKIHFKLINQATGKSRFYPYAEFFRMVHQAYPEAKQR